MQGLMSMLSTPSSNTPLTENIPSSSPCSSSHQEEHSTVPPSESPFLLLDAQFANQKNSNGYIGVGTSSYAPELIGCMQQRTGGGHDDAEKEKVVTYAASMMTEFPHHAICDAYKDQAYRIERVQEIGARVLHAYHLAFEGKGRDNTAEQGVGNAADTIDGPPTPVVTVSLQRAPEQSEGATEGKTIQHTPPPAMVESAQYDVQQLSGEMQATMVNQSVQKKKRGFPLGPIHKAVKELKKLI